MFSSAKNVILMPRDKVFSSKLIRIGLPIMLQQLLMSSLFIFDTVFVGGLGDAYVGAVGQAGYIQLLLWCGFNALSSAGAVFAAQYWGKNKDELGIRKTFTVSLMFTVLLATVFFSLSFFLGYPVMSVLSGEELVRQIGTEYLSIVCFSYPIWAFSSVLASMLRSMGLTKMPMIASISGATINILLDSVFVNGNFGFPKLGVPAAATSTVLGAALELILLLIFARRSRGVLTARLSDLVWPGIQMIKRFLKTALPIIAKDQLWAAGVTVYSMSFAALGITSTAAYNVYTTLMQFMNMFFLSLGITGGILIGHELGGGEIERAKNYAWRLIRLIFLSSLLLCPIFILLRDVMLLPYPNLTPEALGKVREALLIAAVLIWARGINFASMNGILRAGGDTFGAAAIDIGVLWGIGVPLTLAAGMLLQLPFAVVVSVTCIEEFVKVCLSVARVRKYKWAKQIV